MRFEPPPTCKLGASIHQKCRFPACSCDFGSTMSWLTGCSYVAERCTTAASPRYTKLCRTTLRRGGMYLVPTYRDRGPFPINWQPLEKLAQTVLYCDSNRVPTRVSDCTVCGCVTMDSERAPCRRLFVAIPSSPEPTAELLLNVMNKGVEET
ncbi:hypothetical protein NA57DRAFT_52561 [Rhizodiscina lignyota]|uniref:Uncharacterized protein n=1 Tax=Rhizodiscina lignyota TaxID=1504668 RepID=A0A9P4IR71_9PEZI|nr:hypothetical protein NA57DRAFT_52561 [Rhizodiscina lignyota]